MEEELFTELLAKKLSGDISADELAAFNRLVAGNASYQKEFEAIKSYWTQDDEPYENIVSIFDNIKARAGIVDTIAPEQDNVIEISAPRYTFPWLRTAVAVAAIMIISIGVYLVKTKSAQETELAQLQTKSNSLAHVKLPDGTLVTLNSLSVLKYPKHFNGQTREVYLSGEGYFDVASDHTHPFIVHTEKTAIKVLGTAFDLKSYANDGQFEATLFRGSIQATLNNEPTSSILLKPADKLIVNASGPQLTKETYAETAWMTHKLIFKNEPFNLLANSLVRKYGLNIVFKDTRLKSIKLSGEFENENIEQVLVSLQIVTKFNYKVSGNTIYIF
ncbi:FecR family protein [Mucilaginibacter sp. X4EP1]|uniref:FecR family protein n=1 Tax=Mucilaginibacter sp. X4EP1 TaxID=2723092 RepID=UPI00216A8C5C|nr:FecR family protein [Mucilaginibacter sp. X4EP1]MCS3812362.1 ferric-dicitrate binding protein FerR (iron transport regulator) [Mucilaginibacter sp. X4EP1]